MTTSLIDTMHELSKQMGDYWSNGTIGTCSTSTIVDSSLANKTSDWITLDSYILAYDVGFTTADDYEERKITSLSGTTLTLTGAVLSDTPNNTDTTYTIHRLFSPSEKRRAIISALRKVYPALYKEIRDESHVSGNWLKDGSFEKWTTSTSLTYWTATGLTATQTSTAGLFKHGSYSVSLGTAGTLAQSITNNEQLKRLAGQPVTFTLQMKSSATGVNRISINDGITTTYSEYYTSDSYGTGWTENENPLSVTATIGDNPTAVTFTIHYASGTVYVDDARVISSGNAPIYIGDLGLFRNTPLQVFIEPVDYYDGNDWNLVRDAKFDTVNGYMYLPDRYHFDVRLRIIGNTTLNYYDTSNVIGTDWADTISIEQPQLDIIIAQAILNLYQEMSLPNFGSGTRKEYMEVMQYWVNEVRQRKILFGMQLPPVTVNWGI